MKIRRSILLFGSAVAVLIALVLWHGKKKPTEMPPTTAIETNPMSSMATTKNPPVGATVQTNVSIVTNPSISRPSNKAERAIGVLSKYNDVPIIFYGKVEDQFGNPIADATINFGVKVYSGFESTVKRGQAMSDGNGLFTISGYKGESLGIGVKKSGYAFVSMNGSGIYSHLYPEEQRAHPDSNNPVVIKMRKLQGAEPLVGINQRYKLPYTDTAMSFDLLTGKIVSTGGDMKLIVNRTPGIVSERTLQDWSVQIEAVDGGLIKTSSGEARVTYEAPENGYQPSDMFILSTNSPHKWSGGVDQMYFVKSRGGQVYSKINFGIGINQQPEDKMEVEFRGEANINGSRNWEATASQ